jgi:hypothetical protein
LLCNVQGVPSWRWYPKWGEPFFRGCSSPQATTGRMDLRGPVQCRPKTAAAPFLRNMWQLLQGRERNEWLYLAFMFFCRMNGATIDRSVYLQMAIILRSVALSTSLLSSFPMVPVIVTW